jgi:signal transduction histidine kinase
MPYPIITDIERLQQAALEFCSSYSKCAIGIYEFDKNSDEINEYLPTPYFEQFCKKLQDNATGKKLCHDDHINRAKKVFENGKPALILCHAGVFNQALPIFVDGEIRTVILYGQMVIADDNRIGEGIRHLEEVISKIKPNENDELELRIYYDEIKRVSSEELARLNNQLSLLENLYYEMTSKEIELRLHTETIVHELQTRLQPVLAQAETINNVLQSKSFDLLEFQKLGVILLNNVLALRSLIWNLDSFTPPYDFEPHSVRHLIEEALTIYQAEASRKFIKFKTRIKEPSIINMSKVHLQLAINNLVHNAIKYSYRGLSNAERYVEIIGELEKNTYRLSLSNYGVGIKEEEYEKIFTPGYKGELTKKEERTGAGLGLSTVKDVINKHHAIIDVKSLQHSGGAYITTFTLSLPTTQ